MWRLRGEDGVIEHTRGVDAPRSTGARSVSVARSRRNEFRSAASHNATPTEAPRSVSSDSIATAPSAAVPFRLQPDRLRTPWWATRCRASSVPRTPVPPVISTVPAGSSGSRHGENRTCRCAVRG